jgi:hypothetical protein
VSSRGESGDDNDDADAAAAAAAQDDYDNDENGGVHVNSPVVKRLSPLSVHHLEHGGLQGPKEPKKRHGQLKDDDDHHDFDVVGDIDDDDKDDNRDDGHDNDDTHVLLLSTTTITYLYKGLRSVRCTPLKPALPR